jgi:hypothetical protein
MLTADEEVELDRFISESDDLMLLKAQTLNALKSLAKRLSEHLDAKS